MTINGLIINVIATITAFTIKAVKKYFISCLDTSGYNFLIEIWVSTPKIINPIVKAIVKLIIGENIVIINNKSPAIAKKARKEIQRFIAFIGLALVASKVLSTVLKNV